MHSKYIGLIKGHGLGCLKMSQLEDIPNLVSPKKPKLDDDLILPI